MSRVFDLSLELPLDIAKAVETLGGNMNTYNTMLSKYEQMSLTPITVEIAQAVDQLDYKLLKSKVHSLKGSSSYIGAGYIYYCCYRMQEEYMR